MSETRYDGDACMRAIEDAGWGKGFAAGNVMKYVWRYEHKGGIDDLKKAQWYLQRLIEMEGRDEPARLPEAETRTARSCE